VPVGPYDCVRRWSCQSNVTSPFSSPTSSLCRSGWSSTIASFSRARRRHCPPTLSSSVTRCQGCTTSQVCASQRCGFAKRCRRALPLVSSLTPSPSACAAADVTASYLSSPGSPGYWASYNRPAYPLFPYIYNVSGQWPLVEQYGDHFRWDKTARAQVRRPLCLLRWPRTRGYHPPC
jgi:hypothetical protein